MAMQNRMDMQSTIIHRTIRFEVAGVAYVDTLCPGPTQYAADFTGETIEPITCPTCKAIMAEGQPQTHRRARQGEVG